MPCTQASGSHAWHRLAARKAKWRVLDWLLSAHIHPMSAAHALRALQDHGSGSVAPHFDRSCAPHCRRRLTWRRKGSIASLASGSSLTKF